MPLLGNEMEAAQTTQNNFGYSRTRIGNLAASEYTLVAKTFDVSGSTAGFASSVIVSPTWASETVLMFANT